MSACLLMIGLPGGACSPSRIRSGQESAPLSVIREAGEAPVRLGMVPREGAGDLAVARVGGAEIRRSDIGEFLIRYYREDAAAALTHLIDERILGAEAEALGIRLPPELVETEIDRELSRRETRVRVDYGAEMSLERYLREKYGVSLAEHREELRRLVRTRLLRDRVIRYRQRGRARIDLRDAVFADLEDARRTAEAARGGADLGLLAAERGERPHVVLPPFSRDEISPPELADRVFSLSEGEVSDPIEVVEDGRKLYHVFKIVKVLPARTEAWGSVRDEVEADLAVRPIEAHEYRSWVVRARERYGTEILR